MRIRFYAQAAGVLLATMPLLAQQPAQPGSQPPPEQQESQQPPAQQQGPKPKSQAETEALQKVKAALQSRDSGALVQSINDLLTRFPDTDYKPVLLKIGMQASAQKGDDAQTLVWGDRVIANDPQDPQARVVVAQSIAEHTREGDPNKEQRLKKVDDYASKALDLLKTATPPPGIPSEKWTDYKKQLSGEAYDALGLAADVRKKYPDAVANFKSAINEDPDALMSTAHLAKAYVDNRQYDDAISTANKVLAMNEAPPSVKQYATEQKDAATKLKQSK